VLHSSQTIKQRSLSIGTQKKALELLCVCVLVIILTAGLWPFHAPKNEVTWLTNGNGIHFGEYGLILSSNVFSPAGLEDSTSCTVEIWLQPDFSDIGGTILGFYAPENRTVAFSVDQSIDDLFLRRITGDPSRPSKTKLYIEHIFRKHQQMFITITSNAQGTAVYVNGDLVRTSPRFSVSSRDLTGQLVVGNHPLADNGWQGQLKGLTIYDRDLTAPEVLQDYDAWKTNQPDGIRSRGPVALYLINEGVGNVVHNQLNSATDLHIPVRYFVLHEPFLERPWDEFEVSWNYCNHVLINIGGFVPLGFLFCAYFSSVRRLDRAALATIILGGIVSLTIEVLQAFLPTRDSGMTDIFTNTLGTGIGAMLYGSRWVRALLAGVGLEGQRQPVSKR
jgi:VanZ family protein